MNNQPNRGRLPLRFMLATVLAVLPLFVLAVILWDDHHGWAVTCAIVAMSVIVGNYYVRSSAWRSGMWPASHR